MSTTVPARLFALLPRTGDRAAILRRGPNRVTAMMSWNLRDDTFEVGQWHRGTVYDIRCDLSPDGRHMIAALAKYGGPNPLGGYTVVCRPPFFTALAVHGAGHAWGGGGLFVDDRRYWLQAVPSIDSGPDLSVDDRIERVAAIPSDLPVAGRSVPIYTTRLVRDGWTLSSETSDREATRIVTERPIRPRWTLRKSITASTRETGPTGALVWETHLIVGPDGETPLGDEWAEVHGRTVVFAREGCLWRIAIHAKRADEPVRLIDTNPLAPTPRRAPYAGVRRDRAA